MTSLDFPVEVTSGPVDPFDTVAAAIAAFGRGEPVLVVDDEDRENEGDLIAAAELATPETIAFMVRHTSGLLCVGMTGERLDDLQIPLMVTGGDDRMGTAFTVSVDARRGTSTGISATDRAVTVNLLASPRARAIDFVRPGHVFPLRARAGGVLVRPGHTEAAVDLARLAGLEPAGVLAEVVNDDGSMARRRALGAFARTHRLTMITIGQLASYRRRTERLVQRRSTAALPTTYGDFTVHAYTSTLDGTEHIAVVCGEVNAGGPVLARLHSECLTGDVFGSRRCDCAEQLHLAMRRVSAAGRGIIVYLRDHEGRGIGLSAKVEAYHLQDTGFDTVDANIALGYAPDQRDYHVGAQILLDQGVSQVRLMTNNPAKCADLAAHGIDVVERLEHVVPPNQHNATYLAAKRARLGHLLPAASQLVASDQTIGSRRCG